MAKVSAAERMRQVADWRAELTGGKRRSRRSSAETGTPQGPATAGSTRTGRKSSAKRSAGEAFSQA
eukprot:6809430-Alexandrium_andersonii.AAC.1